MTTDSGAMEYMYPLMCLKIAGWVANSVDPAQNLYSVAPDLGPHCLLRPVCSNTYK